VSSSSYLARRAFLARLGVLGAAVTVGGVMPSAYAAMRPGPAAVEALRPVLAELARDTINGLCVFVVPGADAYSRAQGTPRLGPGALEARTPDLLIAALDSAVPFPGELARPVATAFATGLADSGIALTGPLGGMLPRQVRALDTALRTLLRSDETIPLSVAIALAVNLVATQVDPASLRGPFLAPFARLSYARKAEVFRLLEGSEDDLGARLGAELPEPPRHAVSALLRFVAGPVLEFVLFGSFPDSTLTTQALATRTAETPYERYVGDDPWVRTESTTASTGPRIGAGLARLGL
jgi:hypothetical protein